LGFINNGLLLNQIGVPITSMNILSLFDGISAGQLALNRVGIPVKNYYASEIDKYAISVTQARFPDTVQLGDIQEWEGWSIDWESIDLVQGGFPCQSYSVAGKRKGLQDKRGDLIHSVFEVLKYSQPKHFLLENVKGLLHHDKGKTFEYILQSLNECGYAVDWILINSALLSAQSRERVYIVGKRFDKCQGKVYYMECDKAKRICEETINKSAGGAIQERMLLPVSGNDVFNECASHTKIIIYNSEMIQPEDSGILLKDILEDPKGNGCAIRGRYKADGKIEQRIETRKDSKANCLTLVVKNSLIVHEMYPGSKHTTDLKGHTGIKRFYSPDEKSAKDSAIHYRYLTPLECERLQTFPDNYTLVPHPVYKNKPMSKTQRCKMLGNSWTVDVVAHIFTYLK